ncbi:EH signature domain-containing protein [Romboutsia ilealis]|uniref:EH signature domain-containing protein n=1 Tax=Romboutsia ilealis TaxID=1115758 RepID=UPI002573990D|nr:EH signature domain-containing protein [Romboutsia ilealis]
MINNYITPNFNNLKPIKIIRANENIKKSKHYDPAVELKPTKDRFRYAFNLFIKGEYLYLKHYKVLLFYLNDIEQQNYFDKLYDSFILRINSFRAYRGFIRPLTSYIYNYYDSSNNIVSVYDLLRIIAPKLKDTEKYQIIKSIPTKNSLYKGFLYDIKKQFYNVKDSKEIEEILKKVFMTRSDKFYLECMVRFIINNHLNKNLMVEFRSAINRMELETKKEVFTGILEIYTKENDIDKYPDIWFDMILKYLGEPYSQANTKWNGISENLKETFRRWNNSKHLYEFFSKTVSGGDQRRLDFWKQYIDSIYRIRYFAELDNALVMEFKNDVFVEFAKENNALYIYNKKVQNIDNITVNVNSGKLSKSEKIKYLKDRDLGDRLFHRGYWEDDFEKILKRLNYNKGGW